MYQAKISKNSEGSFYAMVIRIDKDGEQSVCGDYNGRHFKTEKAAIKSTSTYIAKC
jgi:hypothetical protein